MSTNTNTHLLGSMAELNPYRHLDPDVAGETYRLNSTVSREDYILIKSVSPEWGTMQTTVNLILKDIADELRRLNINTYNPRGYRKVLSRRTNLSSTADVEGAPLPSRRDDTPCGSAKTVLPTSKPAAIGPQPKKRERRHADRNRKETLRDDKERPKDTPQ